MKPRISRAGSDAGYTYVAIMAVVVTLAMAAQVTYVPAASARRADLEDELIFRGQSIVRAIESYWKAGGATPTLPKSLDDLVSDPRAEGVRHLRRAYTDPITDGAWSYVYGRDGGITGVASTSPDTPRRRAFFPEPLSHFAEATRYSEWTFIFDP